MPKERSAMPVSSNRTRVSPYPLRSSRTNKQIVTYEAPIQIDDGAKEWDDVRCVICMEPPHNAVLLHCSSSANGCRPYICDTSVRHSNCYKQYRKRNKNPETKALSCPLCRGEVFETIQVKPARRFMNAKKRICSVDDCEFTGTFAQLKVHMKKEHHGFVQPQVDPLRQKSWEQMMRNAEYMEVMNAAGITPPQEAEAVPPPYNHNHVPQYNHVRIRGVDGVVRNFIGAHPVADGIVAAAMPSPIPLPRFFMTVFHTWIQ